MNKKTIFSILSIFCIVFTACSDSDNDNNSNTDNGSIINLEDNYFTVKIDEKDYIYHSPFTTASTGEYGTNYGVMTLSSLGSDYNKDKDYGIYNGGDLNITYNLAGEGTYTILPILDMVKEIAKNPTLKILSLNAGVGRMHKEGSFTYEGISGTAEVTIKDDKYHISISEPTILKKFLTHDTPASVAPESASLILQNGHAK